MKPLPLLLKTINSNKRDLKLTSLNNESINFALDCGLGPYLNYCSSDEFDHPSLLSSELTAKIITNTQLQALKSIIDIASPEVDQIILLKGIAICQNYYPQPHYRIMGDIDLLVSEKDQHTLERVLFDLGYQQKSNQDPEFYQAHHHSMPFYNSKNGVWIEVHTHIVSKSSIAQHDKLFSIQNIMNNLVPMDGNAYPENIKCLSAEFQLVYACVHWAEDLHMYKGAVQLIDMVLLINNHNKGLDWKKITSWVDNTASASYLYLLLSYLNKRQVLDIPSSVIHSINLKKSNMGYINRSLLYLIIDSFIPEKAHQNPFMNNNTLGVIWTRLLKPSTSLINIMILPWNILFPPNASQRYNLNFLRIRLGKIIPFNKK